MTAITKTTAFSEAQFEGGFGEGVENHFWFYARNRVIEGAVRKTVGKGKRILDVGCATGLVVEHLRGRGYDCRGVELGIATPRAAVRDHVRTGIGFANLPPKELAEVDAVLLLDVIEHIEKPDEFLTAIKQTMPNLKTIIFAVPARTELWSQFDVDAGHFMRYDKGSMRDLAKRNGLKLKRQSYFFRALYPVMLRADKSASARTIVAPKGMWAGIHRFIATCFMIEAAVPLPIPGTSILAVCEI